MNITHNLIFANDDIANKAFEIINTAIIEFRKTHNAPTLRPPAQHGCVLVVGERAWSFITAREEMYEKLATLA